MNQKQGPIRFIRVRGRVVPIRGGNRGGVDAKHEVKAVAGAAFVGGYGGVAFHNVKVLRQAFSLKKEGQALSSFEKKFKGAYSAAAAQRETWAVAKKAAPEAPHVLDRVMGYSDAKGMFAKYAKESIYQRNSGVKLLGAAGVSSYKPHAFVDDAVSRAINSKNGASRLVDFVRKSHENVWNLKARQYFKEYAARSDALDDSVVALRKSASARSLAKRVGIGALVGVGIYVPLRLMNWYRNREKK